MLSASVQDWDIFREESLERDWTLATNQKENTQLVFNSQPRKNQEVSEWVHCQSRET